MTTTESLGGITFAFGKQYQRMAYALALTLKRNNIPLTVVVSDSEVKNGEIFPGLEAVANVIPLAGKFSVFEYEHLAFKLSPYAVTLKFDADMIIPTDSYLHEFGSLIEKCDLVSGIACDLKETPNHSTAYRKKETALDIPTVYSAVFGFTKSSSAEEFFDRVRFLFQKWYSLKLLSTVMPATTDSLYSIAWRGMDLPIPIIGLPFVHMKPAIVGRSFTSSWTSSVPYSLSDSGHLRINSHLVRLPFHYHVKDFMSDSILGRLEQNVCNYQPR